MAIKVRENRLRRVAARRGYRLVKTRRRDPQAIDFGTYMLLDDATGGVAKSSLPRGYGLTLDDIEAALNTPGSNL